MFLCLIHAWMLGAVWKGVVLTGLISVTDVLWWWSAAKWCACLVCRQDACRVQGSHGGGVLQERPTRGAEWQCENHQKGKPTGRHPHLVSLSSVVPHRECLWGQGVGGEVGGGAICSCLCTFNQILNHLRTGARGGAKTLKVDTVYSSYRCVRQKKQKQEATLP